MSRLVYSTLLPSTDNAEIRWSPSRVTSAHLPSGVNTTWLGPDLASPSCTLPNGRTVPLTRLASVSYGQELPLIWRRDRVPSLTVQAAGAGVLPATAVKALAPQNAGRTVASRPRPRLTRRGPDLRCWREAAPSGHIKISDKILITRKGCSMAEDDWVDRKLGSKPRLVWER